MNYDLEAPVRIKYHKKDGSPAIQLQIDIISIDDDGDRVEVYFEVENAVPDEVLFDEAERIRAGGNFDGEYATLAQMRVDADMTALLDTEADA